MTSISPSTDPTSDSTEAKSFTWNKAAIIVGAILLIGVVLSIWHPLLLAPPSLSLTPLCYGALLALWLPALVVCFVLRPTGKTSVATSLLIGGILVSCLVTFTSVIPSVPIGTFGLPPECEVVHQDASLTRYECVYDRMMYIETYVLEGPTGLPFAWIVSKSTLNL